MPAIGASTTAGSTVSAPKRSGAGPVAGDDGRSRTLLLTISRVGGELAHLPPPPGEAVVVGSGGVSRRVGDHNRSLGPCHGRGAHGRRAAGVRRPQRGLDAGPEFCR